MKDFNIDEHSKIKPGFKIPDGYFDDFSEKMMVQINNKTTSQSPKVISLWKQNKKRIASIAASFIVLFTTGYYFYNTSKIESENLEMEHYLVNQTTITDDDIANLLDENDIQKINIDYSLEHDSSENIDLENLNLEETL